jgi:hypothetical protein
LDHYSYCCNNFKQPGSQECSKWFVTIPEFCTWPTTTTTTITPRKKPQLLNTH